MGDCSERAPPLLPALPPVLLLLPAAKGLTRPLAKFGEADCGLRTASAICRAPSHSPPLPCVGELRLLLLPPPPPLLKMRPCALQGRGGRYTS